MEDKIKNDLFKKTHTLMEKRKQEIQSGSKSLYSLEAHKLLRTDFAPYAPNQLREIMLPMPIEKWYPVEQFNSLQKKYLDAKLEWPRYSHIQYVIDYVMSEPFAHLFSGYAICGDELIPCTFFAHLLLTQKVEGISDLLPEWWVIDPMVLASDKKPDCYIGVLISREVAEKWSLEKNSSEHFLESQMILENQKRSDNYHGVVRISTSKEVGVFTHKSLEFFISDEEKVSTVVNRNLKSIYFNWAINYEGPPPRSLATTFIEHLEYEYYDFDKNWLEKVMIECGFLNKREFEVQVFFIEELFKKYTEQQEKKVHKRSQKKFNIFCSKCAKEDVLPF